MKRKARTGSRSLQPLFRAVMVISAVTILATGVTFAALQSQQAILAGNSIQTATADLKISTDGSAYSNSRTGFAYSEVIPGGAATALPSSTFYLKNSGTPTLELTVAVSTTPMNTDNVDLNKVYLLLTRDDKGVAQKLSLAALIAAKASGGLQVNDSLTGGHTASYHLQVAMDSDAFSGQEASIGGIDLVFSGTARTN
ncbi:MAG: hypothetical protein JWP13_186 [Candidatus Saccharibacteria bacterium]|nr:hypothetical protein [Candidatus Saccharibacteria bacterium]